MQLFALLLAFGAVSHGHYTLVNIGAAGTDFAYVRTPGNQYSHAPIQNLASPQMTCYQEGSATAPKTFSVAAGGQLHIYYSQAPYHPGPYQVYMAKVPSGSTAGTWQPSGAVWFKIYSSGATFKGPGDMFPATWPNPLGVTIPKNLPAGDYLVRPEHIGLHIPGAPQLYLGCGQVTVTGGGSGVPGPLVAFPGAYNMSDPGLSANLGSHPKTYTAPGPAVWTG